MLSVGEVQKHLRDYLFHGLHKHLHISMHFLYNDLRVMYPQHVTAAHKAESEHMDRPIEEVQVRLAQTEVKDNIMSLTEQTA